MIYDTEGKNNNKRQSESGSKTQLINNLAHIDNGFYKSLIENNNEAVSDWDHKKEFKLPSRNKTTSEIGIRDIPSWYLTLDPLKIKREVLIATELINKAKAGSPFFKWPINEKK